MSESESLLIHLLRTVAVVCIVVCHLLQFYHNIWCQIFNIGVQVFWAISGYLYGKKTIDNWGVFYKRRLIKIYVPFIVWTFGVILVYYFKGVDIGINHVCTYLFSLQGETHFFSRYGLKGLGHLWFLTGLWFCYLSLPLLQCLKNKNKLYSSWVLFFLFLTILIYGSVPFLSSYYLWIFAFSYIYGALPKGDRRRMIKNVVYLIASFFVFTTTWEHLKEPNYWRLHHISIGIALLLLTLNISDFVKLKNLDGQFLIKISNLSYFIYLTHMVWIYGPLSLFEYVNTDSFFVISVVVIVTLLSAFILKFITELVSQELLKLFG